MMARPRPKRPQTKVTEPAATKANIRKPKAATKAPRTARWIAKRAKKAKETNKAKEAALAKAAKTKATEEAALAKAATKTKATEEKAPPAKFVVYNSKY